MSIEQALRNRWSTDASLSALVPLARCFTGAAYGDPPLPYVVVTRRGEEALARTSSGALVSRLRLQFTVWTADFEIGRQIVGEISRLFDRTAFDASETAVLNMEVAKREEQLQPDGVWQLAIEFAVLVSTNH